MKIGILGYGREGKSLLKFLKKFPLVRKAEVEILDRKFGKNYLKNLKRFALVFRSPGIPWNLPKLVRARKRGVKFSSATKLFFDLSPARIIGVTGTKGKGTTSTLLFELLKAAGRDVYLAGNIGKPALDLLPRLKKNSIVVLELSSFQLQDLHRSPPVALILDIFPDHLDSHLNLPEYYSAKARIARYQKPGDKIFFFKNNRVSRRIALLGRGKKIAFDENRFKFFSPKELKIKGYHNFKNAAMAAVVASHLGIPQKVILRVVKNFCGLEHRLEFVKSLGGVRFYNDSASTNPHTAAAALHAFQGEPHILIAGGQDKNLNYLAVARALKDAETAGVVLVGENRKKIKKAVLGSHIPLREAENLKSAVSLAFREASRLKREAAVIFSPGAASFDMFKNYADRGRQFKKMVKNLTLR